MSAFQLSKDHESCGLPSCFQLAVSPWANHWILALHTSRAVGPRPEKRKQVLKASPLLLPKLSISSDAPYGISGAITLGEQPEWPYSSPNPAVHVPKLLTAAYASLPSHRWDRRRREATSTRFTFSGLPSFGTAISRAERPVDEADSQTGMIIPETPYRCDPNPESIC